MNNFKPLFDNGKLDENGQPSKDFKDYFQWKCLVIGNKKQLENSDFIFENDLTLINKPNAKWKVEENKIKLSDLCLKTGLFTSKKEFQRKCQQKGLLYNDQPLEKDIEIDLTIPSVNHEVRLGKRFLEIVIPCEKVESDE